jgi:PAS domain S-box-containing protein
MLFATWAPVHVATDGDALISTMRRWMAAAALFSAGLQDSGPRYGMAVAVFLVCALARLLLHPLLGTAASFSFFLLGSTVASLVGGFGPGLLVTILGGIAGAFFVSGASIPSPPVEASVIVQLVTFGTIGASISLFGGFYRERTRELHENQQQLEAVFRQSSAGLVQLDANGRIVLANERFCLMTGWAADAMRGTGVRDLIAPADRPYLDESLRTVASAIRPAPIELRALRPDGSEAWLQLALSPLGDDEETSRGSAAVVLDISSRKQAEARLAQSDRKVRDMLERERVARADAERANRLKEEFLSTLSHELRTPLNAILGWTHLLRATSSIPADIGRGLTVIDRNARAQARIVDELLDMSSIITGKMRLEMRYVALDEVIESTAEGLMPAFNAKGVTLDLALERDAGLVVGDRDRLAQIVFSLLSNALKFTLSGDRVEISLRLVGSQMQISVVDSGKGIARKFLPHVFERFRQEDGSSRRTHSGLGIGLAITKSLTELHGGSVSVTSEGEGRGAQFAVTLPIAATPTRTADASTSTAEPAVSPDDATSLDGVRVLVVDDDEDNRLVVRRLLADHGAEVSMAGSTAEAVERCERFRPHVLLTDLGMPNQDGFDLLSQIRAWEAGSGHTVAAAALTALTRAEDRRRAMSAGFQVHVTKPVEPPELLAVVAGLAGRARHVPSALSVNRHRSGGER